MKDLQEIYELYAEDIYRYLLKLSGNTYVAEELTQETFYKAVLHIGQFDDSENIKPWLITIAKNNFYSFMRKKSNKDIPLEQWKESEGKHAKNDAYEKMLISQEMIHIHKILHTMKEPYKEVFSLRVFGELSFKEIGEVFRKSENWAKVTFFRAKNMMIQELEREDTR